MIQANAAFLTGLGEFVSRASLPATGGAASPLSPVI